MPDAAESDRTTRREDAMGQLDGIEWPRDLHICSNYTARPGILGRITEAKEIYGHRKPPASLGLETEVHPSVVATEQKVKVLVFFETPDSSSLKRQLHFSLNDNI